MGGPDVFANEWGLPQPAALERGKRLLEQSVCALLAAAGPALLSTHSNLFFARHDHVLFGSFPQQQPPLSASAAAQRAVDTLRQLWGECRASYGASLAYDGDKYESSCIHSVLTILAFPLDPLQLTPVRISVPISRPHKDMLALVLDGG